MLAPDELYLAIQKAVAIVQMTADPLSDILQLVRPKAYGFRGLDVGGDWSMHLPAQDVMRCYAVQAGSCGLWLDNADSSIRLTAGDFVLLPHGHGLVLGNRRDAPEIDLDRFFAMDDGKTATIDGGGACRGLGGYFELSGAATGQLLRSLPPVVHLGVGANATGLLWLVERLMAEMRTPRLGGRLIAEHLSQTLLVEALRLHLTTATQSEGSWLAVLAEPRLAAAVEAMHAEPARRWTLDTLARLAGMSRSGFAQRFTSVCGEPPGSYLTRWRMLLAADRLGRGEAISTVALDLGYGSESAFGAAFRRTTGTSPGRLRLS
jgi:AraC-like DNA-binding protein